MEITWQQGISHLSHQPCISEPLAGDLLVDNIFVKQNSRTEPRQQRGDLSQADLQGKAWDCLFLLCWGVNGGRWREREAVSERWLHCRTEGTTCGSFYTPLINGAAAGSPSVSPADSAGFFLIPVSLSLRGGRQYCHGWFCPRRSLTRRVGEQPGKVNGDTTGQCVISSYPQSAPLCWDEWTLLIYLKFVCWNLGQAAVK